MEADAERIRLALASWQSVELPAWRRASVALLLRRAADGSDLEVFFIKRATRKGDRWSGDVAFPGGKQEKDETELQAAKREVLEEVGLDLDAPDSWECLGHLDDRQALELTVRCFIFLQVLGAPAPPPLRLELSEVAACGWCPLRHLCGPAREIMASRGWPRARFDGPVSKSRPMAALSAMRLPWLLGLHQIHFNALELPMRDLVGCGSSPCAFALWGLTLGMVNDFLLTTALRGHDDPLEVYATRRFLGIRVERCAHASLVQSVLAKVIENVLLRYRGPGWRLAESSRWLLYLEASGLLPLLAAIGWKLAGRRRRVGSRLVAMS